MTVTLKRISVSGFKSIREMDLELTSLNVLIGANGAGKSNFIGIFRLLNEMMEKRLRVYSTRVGADSLLYFGANVTEKISIELDYGEYKYFSTLIPTDSESLIFANENVMNYGTARFTGMNQSETHKESLLYDTSPIGKSSGEAIANFQRVLKDFGVYHFQDTRNTAKIKQTGNIDDNRFLRSDGANLAAFLYLLQERYTPFYERIVRVVRLVARFFDTFVLAPSKLDPEKIRLEWRERGSNEYFNAHTLSDGTLRFICLATLLLQPEPPSLILIDEPELGLHPYALNYLAGMIRSVSTQTQVIISTQSTHLINEFEPENIIVVDREDNQSTFKHLPLEELQGWLEEYSVGELWEKNVLGGTP